MYTTSLSVIILTLNEERHIARCIESVKPLVDRIIIVDSGSNDKTCEIAESLGAEVFFNKWTTYSTQFNWAIDNCELNTEWILRLDADEVLIAETSDKIREALINLPEHVTGVTLNLRRIFLCKWLRYGSLYPIKLLRIWRNGYGRSEQRLMDEHIQVDGSIYHINADFADHNLQGITWWTEKHNNYATREAIDFLLRTKNEGNKEYVNSNLGKQAVLKRWIKTKIYYRLPLGSRAFFYFIYRYFIRLGFLDGWPGFVFHFLQGFWYRFLVDVKIYEIRKLLKVSGLPLDELIKNEYGYEIDSL